MAIVNKFILQAESKQLLEELTKAENAYNEHLQSIKETTLKINENEKAQIQATKNIAKEKKELIRLIDLEKQARKDLASTSNGTSAYSLSQKNLSFISNDKSSQEERLREQQEILAGLKIKKRELGLEKKNLVEKNEVYKKEISLIKEKSKAKDKELKEWLKASEKELEAEKKLDIAMDNIHAKSKARIASSQKDTQKRISLINKQIKAENEKLKTFKDSILVYSKAEQVERKYEKLRGEALKAYNDGIISKQQLKKATKNLIDAQKVETQAVNDGTNAIVRKIRQMESIFVAYLAIKKGYDASIGRGHEFNKLIERETVGLKLLIAQNLKNIDTKNIEVTSLEKFEYAQAKATEAIKIARDVNLKTPHTLSETLQIYKILVPQVLRYGGTLKDVGKITKNVSVIASSMGIEFQQLLQTVDSLMSGEMQESALKRSMEQFGITQKEVNNTIKDGGDVVELFIRKLKQSESASEEISKTWAGVTSKFINEWDELFGELQKPLFDSMKTEISSATVLIEENKKSIVSLWESTLGLGEELKNLGIIVVDVVEIAFNALYDTTESLGASTFKFVDVLSDLGREESKLLVATSSLNKEQERNLSTSQKAIVSIRYLSLLIGNAVTTIEMMGNMFSYAGDLIELGFISVINKSKSSIYGIMGAIEEYSSYVLLGSKEQAQKYYETADAVEKLGDKEREVLKKRIKDQALHNLELAKTIKSLDEISALANDFSEVKPTEYVNNSLKTLKNIEDVELKIINIREHISDLESGATIDGDIDKLKLSLKAEEKKLNTLKNIFKNRNIEIDTKSTYISENRLDSYKKMIEASEKESSLRKKISEALKEENKIRKAIKDGMSKNDRISAEKDLNVVIKARKTMQKELASIEDKKLEKRKIAIEKSSEIRRRELRIADDIAKNKLVFESLEYQLKTGHEDKLRVLRKELELLNSIKDRERSPKDELDFKISVKRKELEIAKEIKRLEEERTEELKKQEEAREKLNKEWLDIEQKQIQDFTRYKIQKDTDDFYNSPTGVALQSFGIKIKETTSGAIMPFKDAMLEFSNELPSISSNLAVVAGTEILNSFSKSGDISQAIQEFSESGSVSNLLFSSGNPYAMAAGITGQVLSGVLSEPLDEFQKAQSNIHKDNNSIIGSLSVIESTSYPHLEVARESRDILEKISNSFSQLGKMLSYGSSSGFVLGTDFENSMSYALNQSLLNSTVGNLIGGDLLVGLINGFFGSNSRTLIDSGIRNESQTAFDFVNRNTTEGYQNVENRRSALFGLISSTSMDTITQDLPSDVKDRLSQIYSDGWELILTQGASLGYNRNNLVSIFEEHLTEPMKIALKDATDEEVVQYLQGWFGNEFDSIIRESMPRIESIFRGIDESSMEALSRVSTAFESGNYSISRLGFSLVEFSSIVDNIDLSNLNSDTKEFTDNFYSDTENLNLLGRDIRDTLGSINIEMPRTADGFRDLVDGLDLSTVKGREAFATLMDVSGAMAEFTSTIESLEKSFIENYYSEDEIAIKYLTDIKDEFSDLGIQLPSTREEFRLLVENIDRSTYAGEELRITLLGLQDGFYEATQSIVDLKSKIKDIFDGVVASFEEMIEKIKGTVTSDQTRFDLLVEFNKQQSVYDSFLSSGDLTSDEFLQAQQDLLSITDRLNTDSDSYIDVDAFKDSLLTATQESLDAYTSLSGVYDVSSDATNGDLLEQLQYLNSIVARDATLSSLNSYVGFIPGYSSGGYTGDVGVNDVAGVVHGQEYVIPSKGVPVIRGDNGQVAFLKELINEVRELRREVRLTNKISEDIAVSSRDIKKTNKLQAIAVLEGVA